MSNVHLTQRTWLAMAEVKAPLTDADIDRVRGCVIDGSLSDDILAKYGSSLAPFALLNLLDAIHVTLVQAGCLANPDGPSGEVVTRRASILEDELAKRSQSR